MKTVTDLQAEITKNNQEAVEFLKTIVVQKEVSNETILQLCQQIIAKTESTNVLLLRGFRGGGRD